MAQASIRPVDRSPALHESVKESIRGFILDNRLPTGTPLPAESELAAQLGVSRNSVREAVKALESLGVLETRRGAGLFVGEFSLDPLLESLPYALIADLRQLIEMFEVRRILELGMLDLAILRTDTAQIARLRGALDRMRVRVERGEDFAKEDLDFHLLLFKPVENGVLLKLLEAFWVVFHKSSEVADLSALNPQGTYRDHVAIVDAIARGDLPAARDALDQHYNGFRNRLRTIHQALPLERTALERSVATRLEHGPISGQT
jgi:DNA-binding FadR family transcriptional regulator